MKTLKWDGVVAEHKKTNVIKRKVEGKGEHAKVVTVELEAFILVIEGDDGHRVRLQQLDKPFDMIVNEPVTVAVTYGTQTKLDEE